MIFALIIFLNILVISGCDTMGDLFKTIEEQEDSDKDKSDESEEDKQDSKKAEEKQQQKPNSDK